MTMKSRKILTALFASAALLAPISVASADPSMCGSHAEHVDHPFGFADSTGGDPMYIAACGGDSPAYGFDTAAGGDVAIPSN